MNDVLAAAEELQAVCAARRWRFCFIGGLAVLRWGEPRETADADLTLLTGFGGEAPYIRDLLASFPSRISDAEAFAVENRVLLLRSKAGVGLDVTLGALPYEKEIVSRASRYSFPGGISLRICSCEDLLVMKAFAGRTRDWADVERILVRQSGSIDWPYVLRSLRPLAQVKGEPEILERLERCRAQFDCE